MPIQRSWLPHALLFALACGDGPTVMECPSILHIAMTTREVTLTPGEAELVFVEVRGCAGKGRLYDDLTWTSRNPSVADVTQAFTYPSWGPRAARITGRHAGTTRVDVSEAKHGLIGSVEVTVPMTR